jgi:hypothetical protein
LLVGLFSSLNTRSKFLSDLFSKPPKPTPETQNDLPVCLPQLQSADLDLSVCSEATQVELNQSVETVVRPAVADVMRDLHSTHLAEKQCLAVDIQTYQRVIRRLVCKLKALTREFNKQQITVALLQKAQTQHSQLQTKHLQLHAEHQRLEARFEKTKRVLVEYERDRWKQLCQNEEVISELVSENESLRQMLLLANDTHNIDSQLTYQESEQRAQETKQDRLDEMAELRKPRNKEPD